MLLSYITINTVDCVASATKGRSLQEPACRSYYKYVHHRCYVVVSCASISCNITYRLNTFITYLSTFKLLLAKRTGGRLREPAWETARVRRGGAQIGATQLDPTPSNCI